jgi:Flp pilus assembly protein TadG
MFRLRKLLRLKQDNKGAAAIEAALTFPFLVLLASSTITR